MFVISLLIFLLILMVVVFIHELGHFLAARKNGVLVEEFGLGMPPRMCGVQKVDGKWQVLKGNSAPLDPTQTVFSFNWLPIGGFVRLYGDGAGGEGGAVNPKYKQLALGSASVWGRFVIMIAGVVMNVILATVIYYGLLGTNGFRSDRLPLIGDATFRFGHIIESVGAIAIRPDSPAEKAGIKSQSVIKRIKPMTCEVGIPCDISLIPWQQVEKTTDLIEMVKKHDGQAILIEVQKNFMNPDSEVVTVVPVYDAKENRAMIGIQLIKFVSFDYSQSLLEKLLSGPLHAWNLLSYNYQVQRNILIESYRARDPRIAGDAMGGPVAIASVVNDTIKRSGVDTVKNLLGLTALISLSLAFMNILPIPALDGGRIALLIPEMITGRKNNAKFENYVNIGGFIVLIGLSILVTFKDVWNLFR